ncbi:MAG TPA: hypothetical protein VIX59_13305 [Candidatus Binataceae bacterium]
MAAKRGISVKDLYGGRFISPEAAGRSMVALEKRLTTEFNERTRLRKQFTEPAQKLIAPLLSGSNLEREATAAARAMQRLQKVARGLKVQRLRPVKVNTGIFTGLTGAIVSAPFDYQWTWGAVSGDDPHDNSETADRGSGDLAIVLNTGIDDSSSAAGRAAVGIYFYPPTSTGILQVWSTPALNYLWGTYCSFDSAHADGWIAMYVGSYNLAGAFTGAVIDQRTTLWSDDSWFHGNSGNFPTASYGLHPAPIQVDRQHQYIIWVWCGGEVSADGWHLLNGSGAMDQLYIAVPSITWEFWPVFVFEP